MASPWFASLIWARYRPGVVTGVSPRPCGLKAHHTSGLVEGVLKIGRGLVGVRRATVTVLSSSVHAPWHGGIFPVTRCYAERHSKVAPAPPLYLPRMNFVIGASRTCDRPIRHVIGRFHSNTPCYLSIHARCLVVRICFCKGAKSVFSIIFL